MLAWLGLQKPIPRIGFEEMMKVIVQPHKYVLINTLSPQLQHCLLPTTVSATEEEAVVNDLLHKYQPEAKTIVLYGRNSTDASVDKKYFQILGLGFGEIVVYYGGMFEWLLLQDVYGASQFPTTTKVLDILMYK
jgi:hypothetical protein